MSRSFYHTPISGIAGRRGNNKQWRSQENRAQRHHVRQLLTVGEYEVLPDPKEYGNEWASPRDGKMWFGDIQDVTYRCTVCIAPHTWSRRLTCYCEEFKEHYKELMRK